MGLTVTTDVFEEKCLINNERADFVNGNEQMVQIMYFEKWKETLYLGVSSTPQCKLHDTSQIPMGFVVLNDEIALLLFLLQN